LKKILVLALVLVCVPLSAIPLSAGGGLEEGMAFKSYTWGDLALSGPLINTGIYGFFDFLYGEATLSVPVGFGTGDFFGSIKFNVAVAVLGKYPFPINNALTLFPLLGLEGGYDYAVSLYMSVNAGGGADYYFNEKLYLRAELFYSAMLFSHVSLEDKKFTDRYHINYFSRDHGFAFRVGIGYIL
jgi:hypothetical protein